MKAGICELSYIPMRAGMSHKTEMTNQVLFGELFEIITIRNDWTKIRLMHDSYEAWVETSAITILDNNDSIFKDFSDFIVCKDIINLSKKNDKTTLQIPIGSKIPSNVKSAKEFKILNNNYLLPEDFKNNKNTDSRQTIINAALSMINVPYLWGGRTSWGIDCSGFSQYLYSLVKINLARDASQQVNSGRTLSFVSEAQPGDLAFFDNGDGEIVHVGVIYENGKLIHASGKVKIDNLDHQGIYDKTLKRYTHNLRVVKAIL